MKTMTISDKSLERKLKSLQKSAIEKGLSFELLEKYNLMCNINIDKKKHSLKTLVLFIFIISSIITGSSSLWNSFLGARCLLPSYYFVWEVSRPLADCNYCINLTKPIILWNITRKDFVPYAYSSKPIIVKHAIKHWEAQKVFSFKMFKRLYGQTAGSYESFEEGCQFLNFKTDLFSLKEVFDMSKERAKNKPGQKPWYVGWEVCHPDILSTLRQYYDMPHFLPEDAEYPASENIFLGYEIGAVMHLDYIPRLMWQGQVRGSKYWTIAPVPECEHVCQRTQFYVEPGDVVLLDTRIWYHATKIPEGQLSITVQSEYG